MQDAMAVEESALLTPREERALATQIEVGVLAAAVLDGSWPCSAGATVPELRILVAEGDAARTRFTEANLGLVGMVSRQFASRTGLSEADLFQEACLGLMMAVRRFDCRRGFRFATYALFWIRAYAGAAAAGMLGDLNLPTSRATQLRTVRGVQAALSQSLGRAAAIGDVAAAVGRSEAWVGNLLSHAAPTSLNAVDVNDAWWAGPDDQPEAAVVETPDLVADLLGSLSGLEREVLELRLGFVTGEPLSYAVVAGRLRLGSSRVRRVEQAALERLRTICPYDAARTA